MTEASKKPWTPDEDQSRAIQQGSDPRVRTVGITGAAGTGKTTIMRQIYDALSAKGLNIVVCAPTGKAAKRIHEATGIPAQTIHRLLEFTHPGDINPDTGKPFVESYPRVDGLKRWLDDIDAVLCDEYAMVSTTLHRCLMRAMHPHAVFRVFGDCNQLAPIEENIELRDEISPFQKILNEFNGIHLKTIHRQGEGSGIALNGWRIIQGNTPSRYPDFDIDLGSNPVDLLMNYVIKAKERGVMFSDMRNQIITPTARTSFGTRALNQKLQTFYMEDGEDRKSFNVPRWSKTGERCRMYVGDKVICMKNNYDLGIFNGETGKLIDIDTEYGEMVIDFGDKIVKVPPSQPFFLGTRMIHFDPRKNIDLAYAVTTHKSQGSEYEEVIYAMSRASGRLRSRKNFYTAVSRARKRVAVIADHESFKFALWNTKENFDD